MCCYVVETLSQSDQALLYQEGVRRDPVLKGQRWVGLQWFCSWDLSFYQYVSPKHNSTHFTELLGTHGERLTYVLS